MIPLNVEAPPNKVLELFAKILIYFMNLLAPLLIIHQLLLRIEGSIFFPFLALRLYQGLAVEKDEILRGVTSSASYDLITSLLAM